MKYLIFLVSVIVGILVGIIIFSGVSREEELGLVQEKVCERWGGRGERFNHVGYEVFFCYKLEDKK